MENVKIEIKEQVADDDGWVFQVSVIDNEGKSEHSVSLTKKTLESMWENGEASDLVDEAFKFLLQNESKESILKSFDISEISNYFPEFENVIANRINK